MGCHCACDDSPMGRRHARGSVTVEHVRELTRKRLSARLYIDGDWLEAGKRQTLPLLDPATEDVVGDVPMATPEDLDRALEAAHRSAPIWARTPADKRAAVLAGTALLLRERRAEIASALTLEEGKVLSEAEAEVDTSAAIFDWFAGEAHRIYGRIVPASQQTTELRVIKDPIGPVAIFTPWNFPLVEPTAHVAAALAAGCPVLLKVAEETPLTGGNLLRAIEEAGAPSGVVQLVLGDPAAISDQLIQSPVVKKIAFTGSVPVGKQLAAKAASYMKPSTMELGGNAPAIVFPDIDIPATALMVANAKCRNAGQVCTTPNRIFVHKSAYDEFVSELARILSARMLGPGSDRASQMGPLANVRRVEAMEKFVADAHAHGAQVPLGGRRQPRPGYFFEATILLEAGAGSRVAREEVFGPLFPIFSFSDVDEVVERANGTPAGLAAYVFTRDLKLGRHVAEALEAGSVAINHVTAMFVQAPFGGVKESGFGRICGPEGIEGYLVSKLVSTNFA
jgi:succinate-semialdehyde dehydrogenase / glutarate-semialdehyde dehydrogenase